MDQTWVLFSLRLLSAILLLTLLGSMAWLAYKELQSAALASELVEKGAGQLRIVSEVNNQLSSTDLIPLLPVTRIGRARSNTLVLEDAYVSNEHAQVLWRGNNWWLEDLNSRNGTLLNGVPVMETAVVKAGDIISIGDIQLQLETSE